MTYTEPTLKFLKSNYVRIVVAASALSLTLAFGAVLSARHTTEAGRSISASLADANIRLQATSDYARTVERDRDCLAARLADAQNEVIRAEQDLEGFRTSWMEGRGRLAELTVQADGERAAREAAEKKLRRRTAAAASPKPMVLAQH
jgi:septal ring factor EnvC (AmiA/AmiB activator)